ncbi:MAG: DNA replication and repair protein RecF [Candidatus Bipolaricaulota bacterium]|nr:DNA replication and repair protein RecF [Candidatus Bipolaricaulota bacterium]MDW8030605.1 DNA replication and repair protein RecF [Candidatus Bipolaricaulota bacterium]
MKVERLALYNFRNLAPLELMPDGGLNLIIGPNAAGKSNLCEAIYYVAKGWLLKGERQRDVIAFGQQEAAIELSVNGDEIRVHLNGRARAKTIELNHERKTQSELSARLHVVLFTPDELQILKGRPEQRRRFLDRSISEISREYRYVLREYEQVLQRKSALLHQETPDPEVLEVFNQELVERGSWLIAQRREYIRELNKMLPERYQAICGRESKLVLSYEGPSVPLAQLIRDATPEEIRRRMILVGPHRDDLRFMLDGHDLRRFGSQGEQKSALCAVLLAQLDLGFQRFGDYPILILDDVLTELDRPRLQRLLQLLPKDIQIFLTHTAMDPEELFPEVRAVARRIFAIENGRVIPLPSQGEGKLKQG